MTYQISSKAKLELMKIKVNYISTIQLKQKSSLRKLKKQLRLKPIFQGRAGLDEVKGSDFREIKLKEYSLLFVRLPVL